VKDEQAMNFVQFQKLFRSINKTHP